MAQEPLQAGDFWKVLRTLLTSASRFQSLTPSQRDRLAGAAIAAFDLADDALKNGRTEALVKILRKEIGEALSKP